MNRQFPGVLTMNRDDAPVAKGAGVRGAPDKGEPLTGPRASPNQR